VAVNKKRTNLEELREDCLWECKKENVEHSQYMWK